MKPHLFFLRLFGLLVLCFSTSVAQAKGCDGTIAVSLKHADGTLVELLSPYWFVGDMPNITVSLSAGDTVLLCQYRSGFDCWGTGGLQVKGASFGDTANYLSPVVATYFTSSGTWVNIAQRGSFYIEQLGLEFPFPIRLFIDAPLEPVASGMLFTKDYTTLASVASGDTCSGPCFTVDLAAGQFVRMQPISEGLAQPGGNVVVRYAEEGEPLTFDSPADTLPMVGFEGYQFSAEGTYLLSVEGPMVSSSGYAFVHVGHLPWVDMSLTIERADGTEEDVAYIQPNNYNSNLNVDLGPGDSLRIDHHEITEPCSSVRLTVRKAAGWGPADHYSTLVVDTPSTASGVRMATPGSYFLEQMTDCGIPTSRTRLSINFPPTPQLDLVISVLQNGGTEEELVRSHGPTDPPFPLDIILDPGDSVRAHLEEAGYCWFYIYLDIHVNDGPEDADLMDPYLYGQGATQDATFSASANYLVHVHGGYGSGCYPDHDVQLHVHYSPVPRIDLELDHVQADGTSLPLTYAEAGGPIVFADVELAADDSIRVSDIVQQAPCADVVLKGYRAVTDTATTMDPVFLNSALDPSGLAFRETGSLLLTLEDTCGAITASAHLTVSSDLSTGILARSENRFSARYGNGILLVDTETGGLLQIRNMAGQLMRQVNLAKGAKHHSIPLNGEAGGFYIATLQGPSRVDFIRFAVY